jgi:hypothetical protein
VTGAVTLRERIREALLDARPGGLTMAGLAGAVTGPWRERDVEAAARKLWEVNELARRPGGTFVVTETVAGQAQPAPRPRRGRRGPHVTQRALAVLDEVAA